jgi:diguanylate cyclase (GGDEF)-like protein/PAS domain S-box-containing protein
MLIAPLAPNEEDRLALLHALDILDTPREPVFDLVTSLTAQALRVPVVLVSLVDRDRQWFKSSHGFDIRQFDRQSAFCAHCIVQDPPLVVPDTLTDERFFDNPLVTGTPGIRSYAGVAIRSLQGLPLGTVCAVGWEPREFNEADIGCLSQAALLVSHELHQREALIDSRRFDISALRDLDGEARFRSVFEGAAVGIALIGLDGRWIEVNDSLCRIVGYGHEELAHLTFQDITHPGDLDIDIERLQELVRGDVDRYTIDKRYIRKTGEVIWVNLTVAARRSVDGTALYFISIVDDIQQRVEAQAALLSLQQTLETRIEARTRELQHANDQLRMVSDNVPALVAYFDADLRYQYANEKHRAVLGKDPQRLIGHPIEDVMDAAATRQIRQALAAAGADQRVSLEIAQPLADGSTSYTAVTLIPNAVDNRLAGYYCMAHDVTERHVRELAREVEAREDVLTGVPNRRAFQEHLPQALARADASGESVAVVFLDLDGFKAVNDTLGHEQGDQVLKEVARRLRERAGAGNQVYRLAGDEFVLVVEGIVDREAMSALASTLLAAINVPIVLGAHQVSMSASAGIAFYEAGSEASPSSLLRTADIAMYEAKRSGTSQYRFGPAYGALRV